MFANRKVLATVGIVAILLIGTFVLFPRDAAVPVVPSDACPNPLPRVTAKEGFVSSQACRKCHPEEHASWHHSFHRTMTQVADEHTVLAPFDGVKLASRGRSYELVRRGNEFWVDLTDPDVEKDVRRRGLNPNDVPNLPRVQKQVVMTTGSHHFQGYWLPGKAGWELHQLPFVFDLEDQRWIPVEDVFLRPPSQSRRFATWNTSCIQCHAVAGQPHVDFRTENLWSTVAEFGIACESCHGPGQQHVAKHANAPVSLRSRISKSADSTITNPARCDHRRASQICGQCHSAFAPTNENDWWTHGYRYRAGGELDESQHHFTFDRTQSEKGEAEFFAQSYWPDGTNRVGGREFLGMTASNCYQRGELSCLSCHSLHRSEPNDQLAPDKLENQACSQCHPGFAERIHEHTHHRTDSAGSQCQNCHMPHTSFALLKAIRSHRIDSPRITVDTTTSKPNACNLCHLDQTISWTQHWLHEWYGQPIEPLSEEAAKWSAALRWLLKGDAVQRVIAAWHFSWEPALKASGRDWPAMLLTQVLDDPYAVVRIVAERGLRKLLVEKNLQYDFLAASEQRRQAQKELLKQSQRPFFPPNPSAKPRSAAEWGRLLIGVNGDLNFEQLEILTKQRDDRDLELPE